MLNKLRSIALGLLALGICFNFSGCSGGLSNPDQPLAQQTPVDGATTPNFNPTASQLPIPNDLLRDSNGFVNQFPQVAPFNAEPFTSLATIQGFSTTGNIIIPFTGGVVPSSVPAGILLVDTSNNATINVTSTVLNPFVAGQHTDSTVLLSPVQALKPLHTYVVILTPSLQGSGGAVQPTQLIEVLKNATPLVDSNGNSLITGMSNAQAQAAEPLRQYYQAVWQHAEAATGTTRSNLVFAFQFGTQPEFSTLQGLRAVAAASTPTMVNVTSNLPVNASVPGLTPGLVGCVTPANCSLFIYSAFFQQALVAGNSSTVANVIATQQAAAALGGIHSIFHAQMVVPDYVGYATQPSTGFFHINGTSVTPQGNLNVPVLIVLPQSTGTPSPAIIFQHGITRSKEDVLAVAGAATGLGFGLIAADLPLHGELTLPGINPATGQPFQSGDDFINLASLRTMRDNLRQSSVDLFYLTQSIVIGNVKVGGVPVFLPSVAQTNYCKPLYLSLSLGSIVGTVYASVENNNLFAVLNVPGGRLSSLLLNSPSFNTAILANLAQKGLLPGTSSFATFWWAAQTIVDDADPMNYATTTLNGALRTDGSHATVLIQEALADTVVPFSATTDLVNSMYGISQVVATGEVVLGLLPQVPPPFQGSGLFQFPGSKHSFLLDPSQGNTLAAQTQALTFLGNPTNTTSEGVIIAPANISFPRVQPNGLFMGDIDYSRTLKF